MSPNEKNQTFRYKSAIIFGVSSVLPLLLFLFILERRGLIQEGEVAVIIGLSVAVAVLGFLLFRRMVKQVSTLAEDFGRVERGEKDMVGEQGVPVEFAEMSRIADAFNKTLADLKAHTRELENLIYKLSTLSELTEMVSRIPDINDVLKLILQRTMATVNARIGSIMLLDENNRSLRIATAEGLEESVVTSTILKLGEGIAGKVAQTGEPVLVENVEQDDRFRKPNDPKYETSSFICMPLQAHWRVMGVLNLSKKGNKGAFSESDMKFLNTLLGHIGFALENAKLLKEAKDAAIKLQRLAQEKSLELDQAQQQLIQSVKLSALGQLIAGVAHELNNPLTSIMGYSQLLLNRVPDGKISRDLNKIFDEAQRTSKIVRNLLSFARQERPEAIHCNINVLFIKVFEMRAYDFRVNNIEITTTLAKDLPITIADENQLLQVFLNIVNNAQQAMIESDRMRRLDISTERVEDWIRIEFTDTGPGITPEHMERIFDPFFTTKPHGKGTGLGLSVSYGIVRSHNGDICVRSHPGEGATFIVELPVLSGATVQKDFEETDETTSAKPPIRRILVIEDEETIKDLITEILLDRGYQVDAASTGNLGLQKLMEEEYDFVVCDLRLPGVDGRSLYERMKQAKSDLAPRFIFLTGDIINEDIQKFLEGTGNFYLTKPFTNQSLLEALDKAWERIR